MAWLPQGTSAGQKLQRVVGSGNLKLFGVIGDEMISEETAGRENSCVWHSGFKSDIKHLVASDNDQWKAIKGLNSRLDAQIWLLVGTLAGIITLLVMQVWK